MHRHIPLKNIVSIKYYTDVSIDTFKRWSLPSNDNLMRQSDLYKLTYMSIKKQGLLDPIFCYDVVGVDLNNPPIYRGRQIWGLYLIRGNIRWLCCKDLNIKTMNSIIVQIDIIKEESINLPELFTGTIFNYTMVKNLQTAKDIDSCYAHYPPNTKIFSNHIEMNIPSFTNIPVYMADFKQMSLINLDISIDYAKIQRVKEMGKVKN